MVLSPLGVHAASNFDVGSVAVTAKTPLGRRDAQGEITPSTTLHFPSSDAFTILSLPITRDATLVDAGLDVQVARNATIGLSYEPQFGRRAVSQSV